MHKVEIAPIDANVVARTIEGLLLVVAHPDVSVLGEAIDLFDALSVTAEVGCGIKINAEGVPFLARCNVIKNIGNGAREYLGTVKQQRRQKSNAQFARRMRKGIYGRGGIDRNICLFQCFPLGKISVGNSCFADKAIFFSIDGDISEHRLEHTRPMAGMVIGKLIGKAPNAEIRIVCHKRNCCGTEFLILVHSLSPLLFSKVE